MQILFHSKPESARRNSQCALLPKCQTNEIMIFKRKAKRDDAAQHSTILYTQSNTPRVCHKITNKNIPVRWVGYIAIIYILMAYIETKSSVCLESIFWPNVNHFLSRIDYAQIPLEKVYIQIPRQTGIPLLYIRIYIYIKWKYGLYLLEQLPFNSFFFLQLWVHVFIFFHHEWFSWINNTFMNQRLNIYKTPAETDCRYCLARMGWWRPLTCHSSFFFFLFF